MTVDGASSAVKSVYLFGVYVCLYHICTELFIPGPEDDKKERGVVSVSLGYKKNELFCPWNFHAWIA